jgi:hypothetical protein
MRHLISILIPAFASAFFTSCATYQYVTVSSSLPVTDDTGHLVETDSVAISYSFNGYNGPVKLSVRNKLDIPLYIDWKRSALIMNEETNPFFQGRDRFAGTSDGNTILWSPTLSTTTSTIQGEILRDESVGFVAPHSLKNSNLATIDAKFFEFEGSRKEHLFQIQTSQGPAQAFGYNFEKLNSPLRFRSYLTMAYDPHFNFPITFDHEFWISKVIETKVNPGEYQRAENEYYKRDINGVGAAITLGAIATLGLILISGILVMNTAQMP